MYMVYMITGIIFVMIFGIKIAYEELYLSADDSYDDDPDLIGHPVRIINNTVLVPVVSETKITNFDAISGLKVAFASSFICLLSNLDSTFLRNMEVNDEQPRRLSRPEIDLVPRFAVAEPSLAYLSVAVAASRC